jgi:hypothetical protein
VECGSSTSRIVTPGAPNGLPRFPPEGPEDRFDLAKPSCDGGLELLEEADPSRRRNSNRPASIKTRRGLKLNTYVCSGKRNACFVPPLAAYTFARQRGLGRIAAPRRPIAGSREIAWRPHQVTGVCAVYCVVLRGGPNGLQTAEFMEMDELPGKLTVDHNGRHEHFLRTVEIDNRYGTIATVFRWSYRTSIAE